MQRVLHRNILARNQTLKSQRRKAEEQIKDTNRKIRQENVAMERSKRGLVKAERLNRREDWMLGPLAPNRLAGKDGGGYGMLDFQAIRLPHVKREEKSKFFNFAVGDRVVVVNGREKGKIGKVTAVDQQRQTVGLKDVNMVRAFSLLLSLDFPDEPNANLLAK
jgi:large subunit ribosomal protein L24